MNALTMSADRLTLFDGPAKYRWRGTLDWLAMWIYMTQGAPAFEKLVKDRVECGANVICFGMRLGWAPGLHAANPLFWSSLIPAARIAADHGTRLCPVILSDTATDLGDGLHLAVNWQPHINRVFAHLGLEKNVTLLYANQVGHGSQSRDLTRDVVAGFTKNPGQEWMLALRDNPEEGGNPILPVADGAAWCCERDLGKFFNIGSSMAQIVNGWPDNMAGWPGAHTWSILFESWHATEGGPFCNPGLARQIGRSLCFDGVVGGNAYTDQMAKGALKLTGMERNYVVEMLGNIPDA